MASLPLYVALDMAPWRREGGREGGGREEEGGREGIILRGEEGPEEGRGGEGRGGEGSHRVPFAEQLAGLGQVHLILPEAVQSALHQQLLLLVVLDQLVPERVLGREGCTCS